MGVELMHGDCLELMRTIPDKSVDMVLADPPYGTTACKWDSVIPFEPMWSQLKRVAKKNAAIALFGSEPFSSALRMSNIAMFKYDWVWEKDRRTGYLHAKKRPLKIHENVLVFYDEAPCYFPQMWHDKPMNTVYRHGHGGNGVYGKMAPLINTEINRTLRYPVDIIKFNTVNGQAKDKTIHASQKPVALLEYLIRTYTQEGETVLDFTMGSGSTGVACVNTGRDFIGIELDEGYYNIAEKRIEDARTTPLERIVRN